jgi:hypothetical protein
LAVPIAALLNVFDDAGAAIVAEDVTLQLLVIDLVTERIKEWRSSSTRDRSS